MKLVVISPENADPREPAVLGELFAAGLARYHVRKPAWSRDALAAWLAALPRDFLPRLVLHQHHDLAPTFGLLGTHDRDPKSAPLRPGSAGLRPAPNAAETPALPDSPAPALPRSPARERRERFTSRSCHDLRSLTTALGRYDSVFLSPIFPSLSKPSHAPRPDFPFNELSTLLAHRTARERRTSVLALGGITPESAPRALALGFDGVAVLGAIWHAANPVQAYAKLKQALVAAELSHA